MGGAYGRRGGDSIGLGHQTWISLCWQGKLLSFCTNKESELLYLHSSLTRSIWNDVVWQLMYPFSSFLEVKCYIWVDQSFNCHMADESGYWRKISRVSIPDYGWYLWTETPPGVQEIADIQHTCTWKSVQGASGLYRVMLMGMNIVLLHHGERTVVADSGVQGAGGGQFV